METTSPKFFCFVLMPFSSQFDDIYNIGIKESCENANTYCERVDEQLFQERILDRIYNQIAKADLIIADMSGKNPNVFYEVGYAHALNKPTILLTDNADDIPFDFKHFPHIIYNGKLSFLRTELTKKIQWFKENVSADVNSFKTEIEIYVDDRNLSLEKVVHEYDAKQIPNYELVVHNASTKSYRPGELQIGIITWDLIDPTVHKATTTKLPNQQYLHILPFSKLLFPGSYTSLATNIWAENTPDELDIIIRVFTESGNRDYPLKLKKQKEVNI